MKKPTQIIAFVLNIISTGLAIYSLMSINFLPPLLTLILASTGQLFNLDRKEYQKFDLWLLIWSLIIVVVGIVIIGLQLFNKTPA